MILLGIFSLALVSLSAARIGAGEEEQARLWSLQPLARPALPEPRAGWELPIDRFVLARLEAAGLEPSGEADRATLLRRLSLVLCGLPPASEDVAAFLADEQPGAFAERVEQQLGSAHYGERWARHWLDVARFAETNGFEVNTPRPNAWPYRDWVIRAFNQDKGFDRFLTEQLAGDASGADAATGFLVGGAYDAVLSPDVELTRQQRQDELADMVNTTSTAFLGLTVACARCHDHKFDPISQTDYYSMQALLSGVRHGERPLRPADDAERLGRIEESQVRLASLRSELDTLSSVDGAATGLVALVIDDEEGERARALRPRSGYVANPEGSGRGQRDDRGDLQRIPNIGGGRHSSWTGVEAADVLAYRPRVSGAQRIWVSWGAGGSDRTQDAAYSLDHDGDLATTTDRTLLATVDQRTFADGTSAPEGQESWSGLLDLGVHDLALSSQLVLRAGSGASTSADVVVLEQAHATALALALPRLGDGVSAAGNRDELVPVRAAGLRFRVLGTSSAEPCIDELEVFSGDVNIARGAEVTTSGDYAGNPRHRLEHINDGEYGNDRSWISDTAGSGWIELEFAEPSVIEAVAWARDRTGVYADRLATDYVIEVREKGGEWRPVASSRNRLPAGLRARDVLAYRFLGLEPELLERVASLIAEVQALEQHVAELERLPAVYAGRFEQPAPTRLLYRGDPMAEREVVRPDVPAVFGSLAVDPDAPEQERRLALARWLCDPSNPLTARVLVNRVWLHHFGEGLVDTPSDFGRMGSPPSHPELLDWLAVELIESGWSIKHIQRLIVSSRTWRQSSRPDPAGLARDAQSRLLWRFPPRRMEAEYLRDAILAVAGTLDVTGGGPGFGVFEPNENYVRVYEPLEELGADTWRRMVYMTKVRMERDAVFDVFDTPDAGLVCPKRSRSTTALQALNLFNSRFVMEQAERLAARLEREAGTDRGRQVRRAFQLAFAREPRADESASSLELVEEHGLPALARVLFNTNEFAFVH